MHEQKLDPRHYLWAAIGLAVVLAPFVVAPIYLPFAIFMAVLGGTLGVASFLAILRGR